MTYLRGQGVPRDDASAVRWLRRAAGQGMADAQYALGVMVGEGRGSRKDLEESVGWIQKAAAQGHGEAMALMRRVERAQPSRPVTQ
jgi:TPR repeat protein